MTNPITILGDELDSEELLEYLEYLEASANGTEEWFGADDTAPFIALAAE